jgi:ATP-dependent Clp protease ATP-binding subunit ClpA
LSKDYFIKWDEKVSDIIALKGYDPEYGARPIKREIRNVVEDKISEMIINNHIKEGSTIRIDVIDNNIEVSLVEIKLI